MGRNLHSRPERHMHFRIFICILIKQTTKKTEREKDANIFVHFYVNIYMTYLWVCGRRTFIHMMYIHIRTFVHMYLYRYIFVFLITAIPLGVGGVCPYVMNKHTCTSAYT